MDVGDVVHYTGNHNGYLTNEMERMLGNNLFLVVGSSNGFITLDPTEEGTGIASITGLERNFTALDARGIVKWKPVRL